ncbi:hypothetical protein Tco_0967112 [Tanacetum coccineum]
MSLPSLLMNNVGSTLLLENFWESKNDESKSYQQFKPEALTFELAELTEHKQLMMDDPNITIEEYIKLQAEKAQRRGRTFNYLAIIYDDALTSNKNIWLFHLEIRDISTLDLRVENTRTVILQILRRGLGRYTIEGYTGGRVCLPSVLRGDYLRFKAHWYRSLFWSSSVPLDFERRFLISTRLGRYSSSWVGLSAAKSARQILDKGDLGAYWRGISSEGDFLGTTSSYTAIRDPIIRLYHRLIGCNIAERSQAPKKEIALERKQGVMISRDFSRLDDTWDWVAVGPKRQSDAASGAAEVAEGAPVVDKGAQDVPAPVQVPYLPFAAA